jgi:hypothetical protein
MPIFDNSVNVVARIALESNENGNDFFFAAASAPLRTRPQNESPSTSWVIIAIVTRECRR